MAQVDWHWWRQEAPALLVGAVLLLLVVLFFRWLYDRPPADDRPVVGKIVGFHGYLSEAQFRNVVRATVRLSDGRNVIVQMPRSGRGAHCRAGDEVKLVQNGILLRVFAEGCPRR